LLNPWVDITISVRTSKTMNYCVSPEDKVAIAWFTQYNGPKLFISSRSSTTRISYNRYNTAKPFYALYGLS